MQASIAWADKRSGIGLRIWARISADHFNSDSQRELFPNLVSGVRGSFALNRERQTGPIAKRKPVGSGDFDQPASDSRLLFVEWRRHAAYYRYVPPSGLLIHASRNQLRHYLSQIYRAYDGPR